MKYWYRSRQFIRQTVYGVVIVALGYNSAFAMNNDIAVLEKKLAWWDDPTGLSICQGSYHVDEITRGLTYSLSSTERRYTHFKADHSQISLVPKSPSIFKGHVTLIQADRRLSADKAMVYRSEKTKEFERAALIGNVRIELQNQLWQGNDGQANLISGTAKLNDVVYRVLLPRRHDSDLVAWGEAAYIEQLATGDVDIASTSYTTCPPASGAWVLKASKIKLDRAKGRGSATHARLSIHGMPVFYSPYFNFPIDKRRQSGFLIPHLGHSSRHGVEVDLPYYFNIAPNYDAVFSPGYFSKRGVKLGTTIRYLTKKSTGKISGEYINSDQAFTRFQNAAGSYFPLRASLLSRLQSENNHRYVIHWSHDTYFNPHWSTTVNFNQVSDDYYFQDFQSNLTGVTDNQLVKQYQLNYADLHWDAAVLVEDIQTLHPMNQPAVATQYSRLPQVKIQANYPGNRYNFLLSSSITHFKRPQNPETKTNYPSGNRMILKPSINMPFSKSWGYITPALTLQSSFYDLNEGELHNKTVSQHIPIISVDSGLFFDKKYFGAGEAYHIALEPRAFYLYVPYKDNDGIPLFDTAAQPFTAARLFQTNRFSGDDRMGDANQLSVALTARWIEQATGNERIYASIGQTIYFSSRRVSILSNTDTKNTVSPIAVNLLGHLTQHWSSHVDFAWDPNYARLENANITFHYEPKSQQIINLAYYFVRQGDQLLNITPDSYRNNLEQTSISFSSPLRYNWSLLGHWAYNLSHRYHQSFFYGLEYNSCCWAVRLISERFFTSLTGQDKPNYNNVVYLQFQLKGLGSVSNNNPSQILTQYIPGYYDHFG